LNSFCTNDVKRLQPGEHCEAFITNVKGKTLGHGLVVCRDEEFVFITVPGQAATLIEHLDHYIIREDVQLRDSTAERAYFLVAGGDCAAVPVALGHWIRWRIFETEVCGLLEVSAGEVDAAKAKLTAAGATICGAAAFDAVRIESGMPLFSMDFNAENLPQQIGRDDAAISFTKGCYLGQETVARIDALGHVNQQLAGVRFAEGSQPTSGCELTANGSAVGHASSIAFSPKLNAPLALAMVRRTASALGTELDSPVGKCEIVELPLD
jgi:folate-binding protein YgfZ